MQKLEPQDRNSDGKVSWWQKKITSFIFMKLCKNLENLMQNQVFLLERKDSLQKTQAQRIMKERKQ